MPLFVTTAAKDRFEPIVTNTAVAETRKEGRIAAAPSRCKTLEKIPLTCNSLAKLPD
jgi:hypothetical protein